MDRHKYNPGDATRLLCKACGGAAGVTDAFPGREDGEAHATVGCLDPACGAAYTLTGQMTSTGRPEDIVWAVPRGCLRPD